MKKRLLFLKQDGWFEVKLTITLSHAPYEELIRIARTTMECHGYRNYMITENPEYVIANHNQIPVFKHPSVMING